MEIFQEIGKLVESALKTLQNASLNEKFVALQGMVSLLLVLTIMYKGFETIMGRNKDPIRDLIWDTGKKMFILTFVLNVNGWLNLCISALEGFYDWAGGGMQFYGKLDAITSKFVDTVSSFWKNSGMFTGDYDVTDAILVIIVATLSFIVVIIPFAFLIINASITNTFLIIVLPLALFCGMYQITRGVLNQWVAMFMSNIFLLLFMGTIVDFLIDNFAKVYTFSEAKENTFFLIVKLAFWAAIFVTIIAVIKTIAEKLAQVSLDAAANSGMGQAMGMAGGAVGLGFRGIKGSMNAGLGAVSGSAAAAATSGGLAGLAGYGIKKFPGAVAGAATSGAKKLFSAARNKQ